MRIKKNLSRDRGFNQHLFSITLVSLTICSCVSFRNINNDIGIPITTSNLYMLNGKYDRNSSRIVNDTISFTSDLCDNLIANTYSTFFHPSRWESIKNDSAYVGLNVINVGKIKVSYINGTDTLDTKIFKGKIKHGYFEFKRNCILMSILYATFFSNSKVRIKLSTNGDIVADYKERTVGLYQFLIPGGNKIAEYDKIFKRIE